MAKVRGDLGIRNSGPLRPFVMFEDIDDFTWMTPAQARRFAHRILKQADLAEKKFIERNLQRTPDVMNLEDVK